MHYFRNYNPYPLVVWVATTILVLCLTSTGSANAQDLTQTQQQIVTNLQNSSSSIKLSINKALASTANFSTAATGGYIVDPTAYTSLTLTSTQVTDYNNSLSTFQSASFYDAKQFLTDQAKAQIANMQTAITGLSTAAVDLQMAATVNQIVSGITDSSAATAAQAAITRAGLDTDITADKVSAFNSSLEMVNTYASQAGAFFASANNASITSSIDLAASNYNKSLYTSTVAYTYNQDYLNVQFDPTYSIGFTGFTTDKQLSAIAFFTQPQLYGGQ